jgi:hypothetical protein
MSCSREYRALSSALHLSTASPCSPYTHSLTRPCPVPNTALERDTTGGRQRTRRPMVQRCMVRCSCAFPSFFYSRIWASASASCMHALSSAPERVRSVRQLPGDIRPHMYTSPHSALACRLVHDAAGILVTSHPLPCSTAPLSQGFRWLGRPTGRATQSARTALHHVAAGYISHHISAASSRAIYSMYISLRDRDGGCTRRRAASVGACLVRVYMRRDDAVCVCVLDEGRDSEQRPLHGLS